MGGGDEREKRFTNLPVKFCILRHIRLNTTLHVLVRFGVVSNRKCLVKQTNKQANKKEWGRGNVGKYWVAPKIEKEDFDSSGCIIFHSISYNYF